MSNLDTIKAITENLAEVLTAEGLKFSQADYEAEEIPASLLPAGRIFYLSERFEENYFNKPKYIDADYLINIVLRDRDSQESIRNQQKWVHTIREALYIDALNINDLETSKLINGVTTDSVVVENRVDGLSVLNYQLTIRYREL